MVSPSQKSFVPLPAFSRKRDWLILLLLATACIAVFWRVSGHDFVNYDDYAYVTLNPMVQQGLTSEGVKWAFTELHGEALRAMRPRMQMIFQDPISSLNPRRKVGDIRQADIGASYPHLAGLPGHKYPPAAIPCDHISQARRGEGTDGRDSR